MEVNTLKTPAEVGLVEGISIKITKVKMKKGFLSKFDVGKSIGGQIDGQPELGQPVLFSSGWYTSPLERVFTKNDKIHIETFTSVYEVTFL